jgi:hypothetical protein
MNRKTKTVLAVLLIAAVMLVSCGSKTEKKIVEYTLGYGETLWEIYEEYGNGMVCIYCHHDMDHTDKREEMLREGKEYLIGIYPDWSEEKVKYKKEW